MKWNLFILILSGIFFTMCNSIDRNFDPVVEINLDVKKITIGRDTGTLTVIVNHSSNNQSSNDFNFIVTAEVKLDSFGTAKGFKYFNQEFIEQESNFCYKEVEASNNSIVYKQKVFTKFNNAKDTILLEICNNSISKIPINVLPCNINISFMNFKNGSRGVRLTSNQVSTNFYLTQ